MSKLLILLLLVGMLSGCDRETAAEKSAAAHIVCRDAGLLAKEGVDYLGDIVVYCVAKEQPK
jgi:hypothetical protein